MDVGLVLYMVGLAYGLGVFWYSVLPAHLPEQAWRVAALPFAAIALGEALTVLWKLGGPTVGGLHVLSAVVAALVAVVLDWVTQEFRHPAVVAERHAVMAGQS